MKEAPYRAIGESPLTAYRQYAIAVQVRHSSWRHNSVGGSRNTKACNDGTLDAVRRAVQKVSVACLGSDERTLAFIFETHSFVVGAAPPKTLQSLRNVIAQTNLSLQLQVEDSYLRWTATERLLWQSFARRN